LLQKIYFCGTFARCSNFYTSLNDSESISDNSVNSAFISKNKLNHHFPPRK